MGETVARLLARNFHSWDSFYEAMRSDNAVADLDAIEGIGEPMAQAIKDFFDRADSGIRWVKQARRDAEPSHLQSLFDFAARAYRRPLPPADREDLLSFYRESRERYGLDHEGAIRESIVLVLTSPKFSYRVDLVEAEVPGLRSVVGDLRALPFPDESFDVLVCVSTIEHVGHDNRVYGAGEEHLAGQGICPTTSAYAHVNGSPSLS